MPTVQEGARAMGFLNRMDNRRVAEIQVGKGSGKHIASAHLISLGELAFVYIGKLVGPSEIQCPFREQLGEFSKVAVFPKLCARLG
jgi:hypothetical protein